MRIEKEFGVNVFEKIAHEAMMDELQKIAKAGDFEDAMFGTNEKAKARQRDRINTLASKNDFFFFNKSGPRNFQNGTRILQRRYLSLAKMKNILDNPKNREVFINLDKNKKSNQEAVRDFLQKDTVRNLLQKSRQNKIGPSQNFVPARNETNRYVRRIGDSMATIGLSLRKPKVGIPVALGLAAGMGGIGYKINKANGKNNSLSKAWRSMSSKSKLGLGIGAGIAGAAGLGALAIKD
jgi:hypothetical protein